MPVAHHAIDVAATPADCWAAFARLADWPRWFPFCRSARGEAEPWRVGARLTLELGVAAFPPARIVTTIEELVVGERVRWRGASMGVVGEHAYHVAPGAAGLTRFTSHEEFKGPLGRFLPRRIFDLLDQEAHRSMSRFKALIEASR
jgi:hypothetical protein